jgi:hypothetical protein
MTFDEVLTLAESCLAEYGARLKVQGKRPYSEAQGGIYAVIPVVAHDNGADPLSDARRVRATICEVLDKLVAMKDGFVMSDPPRFEAARAQEQGFQVGTVSRGDLILRFKYGIEKSSKQDRHLWIECWVYSPEILQFWQAPDSPSVTSAN